MQVKGEEDQVATWDGREHLGATRALQVFSKHKILELTHQEMSIKPSTSKKSSPRAWRPAVDKAELYQHLAKYKLALPKCVK